jgi:hypothetical protein
MVRLLGDDDIDVHLAFACAAARLTSDSAAPMTL